MRRHRASRRRMSARSLTANPCTSLRGRRTSTLAAPGVVATCNPMGAGKWRSEYSEVLAGADVIIVADRDAQGRAHAAHVAASLDGIVRSARVVEPATGKDAADHLAAGHGLDAFAPSVDVGETRVEVARPLAELLRALVAFVRAYVVVTHVQAVVLALWIAHAHAIDATSTTPYVHVTSPEPESGKSRLAEVLELLVPRPLTTAGSVTVAVMFRAIDALSPSLILDEADNVFKDRAARADVLGVINSGYRRGQQVLRMGGAQHDRLDSFSTFCPKVIVGLDGLTPTLASRCLRIEMRRRRDDEQVEPFYIEDARPVADGLRAELAAWAEDAVDELATARPARLGVRDRLEEGIRLLLAVAEQAGEEWNDQARAALLEVAGVSTGGAETLRTLLLTDIRDVFAGRSELTTVDLLAGLFAIDTSPWADRWGDRRGDETTPSRGAAMKLSRMLQPFGIRSHPLGEQRHKGYRHADFEDAFARYLPPEVAQVAQSAKPSGNAAPRDRSDGSAPNDHLNGTNPHRSTGRTTRATSHEENALGGTDRPTDGARRSTTYDQTTAPAAETVATSITLEPVPQSSGWECPCGQEPSMRGSTLTPVATFNSLREPSCRFCDRPYKREYRVTRPS
jgi:Protein of unknown function (DUF3631)